jgi:hypothetical protein
MTVPGSHAIGLELEVIGKKTTSAPSHLLAKLQQGSALPVADTIMTYTHWIGLEVVRTKLVHGITMVVRTKLDEGTIRWQPLRGHLAENLHWRKGTINSTNLGCHLACSTLCA